MAQLKNPRRERLAQALARGSTQVNAAIEAGFETRRSDSAKKLAHLPEIEARVAELLAEAARANEVTLERWLAEIAGIAFAEARGPAVHAKLDALDKLAKHFGWYAPTRSAISGNGHGGPITVNIVRYSDNFEG